MHMWFIKSNFMLFFIESYTSNFIQMIFFFTHTFFVFQLLFKVIILQRINENEIFYAVLLINFTNTASNVAYDFFFYSVDLLNWGKIWREQPRKKERRSRQICAHNCFPLPTNKFLKSSRIYCIWIRNSICSGSSFTEVHFVMMYITLALSIRPLIHWPKVNANTNYTWIWVCEMRNNFWTDSLIG